MRSNITATQPTLIVVMGVAGSGKTTVARALAETFGLDLLDADDFHSEEARHRMASGIPLDDAIRAPWIRAICSHLAILAKQKRHVVLAFSGLKRTYREPLRHTGYRTLFLFLNGHRETILQRMRARTGHFMPPELLESQLTTLEPPVDETDAVRLDVGRPVAETTAAAVQAVRSIQPPLEGVQQVEM